MPLAVVQLQYAYCIYCTYTKTYIYPGPIATTTTRTTTTSAPTAPTVPTVPTAPTVAPHLLGVGDVLVPVDDDVGVGVAPPKGPKLRARQVQRHISNLRHIVRFASE